MALGMLRDLTRVIPRLRTTQHGASLAFVYLRSYASKREVLFLRQRSGLSWDEMRPPCVDESTMLPASACALLVGARQLEQLRLGITAGGSQSSGSYPDDPTYTWCRTTGTSATVHCFNRKHSPTIRMHSSQDRDTTPRAARRTRLNTCAQDGGPHAAPRTPHMRAEQADTDNTCRHHPGHNAALQDTRSRSWDTDRIFPPNVTRGSHWNTFTADARNYDRRHPARGSQLPQA